MTQRLTMLAGIGGLLLTMAFCWRRKIELEAVGLDNLTGWDWDRFVTCEVGLNWASGDREPFPCPDPLLETFGSLSQGCGLSPAESGVLGVRRLLLLADGLSSPRLETAFQQILEGAAEARVRKESLAQTRRRPTGARTTRAKDSTSPPSSTNSSAGNEKIGDDELGKQIIDQARHENHTLSRKQELYDSKRILVVLDPAYGGAAEGAWGNGSAHVTVRSYCEMRTDTFQKLGASAVTCVLLDPVLRANFSRWGIASGGADEEFGLAMGGWDDDMILEELGKSTAVWLGEGDPDVLLAALQRPLVLRRTHFKPEGGLGLAESPLGAERSSHQSRGGGGNRPQQLEPSRSSGFGRRVRRALRGEEKEPTTPSLSFGDVIREKVLDGSGTLAYMGISAGTIVAGETLFEWPSAKSAENNTVGLRLVPNCSFWPHMHPTDFKWMQKFAVTRHKGIMGVPNCFSLVDFGDGEGLQYLCSVTSLPAT